MDAGVFFGGIGIQVGADALQAIQDLVGAALLGAFEDQVLDKVSQTRLLFGLIAGAAVDQDAGMGNCRGGRHM